MNYKPGTPVNLVERFWLIDPLTEVATLSDPGTVVFHVETPDGDVATYTFGVDSNVTHPEDGTYVCLVGPYPEGTYTYNAVGTAPVVAQSGDKTFTVTASAIEGTEVQVPVAGPCQPWISGDDVADCGGDTLGVGSATWLLDSCAVDASSIMFALSGRMFPGVCTKTVRPCRNACGCWGDASSGWGSWSWASYGGASWGWFNDAGGQCGCDQLSEVRLSGYPIRAINEVKINGDVMPEFDDAGDRNWRLDRNRRLVRMDSPVDGRRYWPGCQNLSLDDTQDGTFAVTYRYGAEPPTLGKAAAARLAVELFKSCSGQSCALPDKATKIVRQGITIDRVTAIADMLRSGSTGIQLVDTFIATYNPTRARRRPAVWTPDVQRFAREVG